MSQQQPTSSDEQGVVPGLNILPGTEIREGGSLPAFQSFPARTRSIHTETGPGGPSSGYPTTQRNTPSDVAPDSSYQIQTADDVSMLGSRRVPTDLLQRQRTTPLPVLPSFTPFPAASRSSRYAPSAPRIEPTRATTSSTYIPESTAWTRVQTTTPPLREPPAGASASGIRVPR
ncbi:hypothetical protein FRC08_009926 [Ceratobasidium sp. 394]|nr:hypothetical protein FRC08_009926 [Ceratobasidium sp. 394]